MSLFFNNNAYKNDNEIQYIDINKVNNLEDKEMESIIYFIGDNRGQRGKLILDSSDKRNYVTKIKRIITM